MSSSTAGETHVHQHHLDQSALPQHRAACSWCKASVGRKPVSGARLSHMICRLCTQQFLARTEDERNRRWI